MKKFVFCVLVMGIAMSISAQSMVPQFMSASGAKVQVPAYTFASGSWGFNGLRLFQNDAKARLAKANFGVPQSGIMQYQFDVRYEGGAEDGHGGFGIHIFVDRAFNKASWGAGKSWLLWLNYDEKPLSKDIPSGLSGQIYKSVTNSRMDLIASVSLADYEYLLTDENLTSPVTFRIIANGDTGEIRIYDPTDPNNRKYFYFFIDKKDLPMKGSYIALRTNGIKLSFAMEDAGK